VTFPAAPDVTSATAADGVFRKIARAASGGAGLSVCAVLLLVVLSAALAPSSISAAALFAMLPFAAILGIASIGQQLVIQQRGLDLSVGGSISLVCVLATYSLPAGAPFVDVLVQLAIAIVVAVGAGVVNGLLIARLHIPSLVTTIGMNALLMGFVLWISGGTPGNAPDLLDRFALGRTLGIPNTVLIAIVVTAVAAVIMTRTIAGRRFVLVGVNAPAARAAGIRTGRYEIGAYALAGLCYAIAGILLAGLLNVPNLTVGQTYLLATVAAVVVGGNSLSGGRASPFATVIGALFMTQLGQMLFAAGLDRSVQYLLQGAIVIAGASVHVFIPRWAAR